MSTLDDHFTIGKVAFGKTDYLEVSAYFSIILGLFFVIYFQLFCTLIAKDAVSQSEAKMVEPANRIESESVSLKMTPSKTLPAVASPQSRRKTPTKKIDAGPSTPRRSERILSKTPSKKFE